MKKVFAILAAGLLCFGAFAQESSILEDWEDKIEGSQDEFVSSFAFLNFTYNNFLAASTMDGVDMHGWGLEISALHIGFNPWKNGRFTLGLFDMAFDNGYLLPNWTYVIDAVNKDITVAKIAPEGNKSRVLNFAFMFPIGYIQKFGDSRWSAGIFASPGFGFNSYNNEWVESNVRRSEDLNIDRGGGYFRLDLKAMIWYQNFGIVGRYTFPKNFQGPGVVAVGLSMRL